MVNEKERLRTNSLLLIMVIIASGVVLWLLRSVLIPLAVAFFLSYIAMPFVRFGKRTHLPVGFMLVIVIVFFMGLIGGIGWILIDNSEEFVSQVPDLIESSRPTIEKGLGLLGQSEEDIERIMPSDQQIDIRRLLERIPGMGAFALSGVDTIFSILSFSTLVLLYMVFIVLDRGHGFLDRRMVAAFSKAGTESAAPVIEEVHRKVERYIITKTGISIITALLVAVTLSLFGIPFAVLFALLTFLLNYIPNVGSIIATIPPVGVAFATLPTPIGAVPVACCLIIIQFGVGNFLEPVILGKQLRLNPITVLLALVFWGFLWGFWGMVLAVPITAVIKIITEGHPNFRAVAALMDE